MPIIMTDNKGKNIGGGEYVVNGIDVMKEIETLRVKNDLLRAALSEVAGDDWNNPDWVRAFARDALSDVG